jgi:hypothetical protein
LVLAFSWRAVRGTTETRWPTISSKVGYSNPPRYARLTVEMVAIEESKTGTRLGGLDPKGVAEVVQVARFGADALNPVFRVNGRVGERLVYRGEETAFDRVEAGGAYAFGGLRRLASEAYRICLTYLFDPCLAVSASQIGALPHQIIAVYRETLSRQPQRFLFARCLILAPGALVEQCQEELVDKFGPAFELPTRDQIEASIRGNLFVERNRLIVRVDLAARSDDLRAKLEVAPDWDLIVYAAKSTKRNVTSVESCLAHEPATSSVRRGVRRPCGHLHGSGPQSDRRPKGS